MAGKFFDTNVLLYIASGDAVKADRAEAIIAEGGVISVQVLNELTNIGRRKLRMTWPELHALLATMRALLTVQPITMETHETGLALAERYNLFICDAMILASALQADCDILWSEDMQQDMIAADRLRVVNPFHN